MFIRVFLLSCILSFQANANIETDKVATEQLDYSAAIKQLEVLAKVGNFEAQYNLALIHYQGKSGVINKPLAFAWFFMAAEYDFQNSQEYANIVFAELSKKEQVAAKKLAKTYRHKYGQSSLLRSIFPLLFDDEIKEQALTEKAKLVSAFELRDDDIELIDKVARGRKAHVNQRSELTANLNKGYRHNAYDNMDKYELEDASGLVIVQYDTDVSGKVNDPEVIFSWPIGKFDQAIVNSVLKNTYEPAKRKGEAAAQYNLVSERRIGKHGKNSFRTEYPQGYKYFLKMKKESADDVTAKYVYANMLRAYEDIIGAPQAKSYQTLLFELAKDNHTIAQYDYAQYLIYEEDNIDQGLYWLVKAAKAGFTQAEYRLGDILLNSPSALLKEDKNKAKFWLTRAANKGYAKAQSKLARLNK